MQEVNALVNRIQSTLSDTALDKTLIQFNDTMSSGGLVMWIIFALGALLWFAMAARFALLGFGPVSINKDRNGVFKLPRRGLLGNAARDAVQASEQAEQCKGSKRHFVMVALMRYRNELNRYSILIKTIVLIAPLLGLLGTVNGMIETFEALQTLSIFSQGSSIAGGISKALYTTQMGLVVAVPGLLIGRLLDRRQAKLVNTLEQIDSVVVMGKQS